MRKLLVVALAFLTIAPLCLSQAGFRLKTRSAAELYAEQRRVVGTWCRQDFEGLRLTDAGWDRFKSSTTLRNRPDFTSVVIVSRYEFEPRDFISWEMAVSYTVVGRYEIGGGYTAEPGLDPVKFQTKDVDGEIVITGADPMSPHVSKKAAIDWMKKQLETTNSEIEKIHLRDALTQLEAPAAGSNQGTR